jgi:hypothetical protein
MLMHIYKSLSNHQAFALMFIRPFKALVLIV